jgi:RHS repeat-associated protein
MKYFFLVVFTILTSTAFSQNTNLIVEFEYWFDDAYGNKVVGSSIIGNPLTVNIPFLSTSGLNDGLHSFHIRFKDNQPYNSIGTYPNFTGFWSVVKSQYFYKSTSVANNKIQAYEYTFNSDTPIYQTVSQTDSLVLNVGLSTASLQSGLNTFHIRFQDLNGQWSVVKSQYFYKPRACNLPNLITAYRYWFNDDSTFTNIQLDSAVNPLTMTTQVQVPTSVPSGFNLIHFQFKDTCGLYSVAITDTFEICDPTALVGTCQFCDLPPEHYAYTAGTYICNQDMITKDGLIHPDDLINRAELAKLAFLSIGLDSTNSYASGFPTPYYDLQDSTSWYYDYAINLLYLEFGDGVTPFSRDKANFYPSANITRGHILKVLLETWNDSISVNPNLLITDIDTTHEVYAYVNRAVQLGIITDQDSTMFGIQTRTNDFAARGEVFVMLHRIMTTLTPPTIDVDAFYRPGNYTPYNLAQFNSLHSGNFNYYTKTSFNISDVGIPLTFEHTYNSYSWDLPNAYFALRPLGNSWTHTYSSYLMEVPEDEIFPQGNSIIVALPNGGFHAYRPTVDTFDIGHVYLPVTKGVYNKMEKLDANTFIITTKNQIVFTYQKPTNTNSDFPFVLVAIRDRSNNQVNIVYEDANELGAKRIQKVQGTSGTGRELDFTYYPNSDLLHKVTDPINRDIEFEYDDTNRGGQYARLTKFKDMKDLPTLYDYTIQYSPFLLTRITLPKGNEIDNQYENRKLKSIKTNQGYTKFDIQPDYTQGIIDVNIEEPNGLMTTQQYDLDGLLQNTTNPSSAANITYDATHTTLPSSITVNGQTINYQYDSIGNPLQIALPEGVTHSMQYNAFNDVTQYTDPRGKVYQNSYDGNGRLTQSTTPTNAATSYNVNTNGTIASITNPAGILTNMTHNSFGDVTGVTAPENINMSFGYDSISRPISVTLPNGHQITKEYDANDNLTKEINVHTTLYEYNPNNLLSKITNAKGVSTILGYDFDNDYLTQIDFGSMSDVFVHDSLGRMIQRTDPSGTVFTYTYNNKDLLTQVSGGGNTTAYTYDAVTNNITQVDYNGTTAKFWYDNLNRVTKTEDMFGNQVLYTYDAASNITQIEYPNNKIVNYHYDDDNRLKLVIDWQSDTTEYFYRADGLLDSLLYPNQTAGYYNYDNAGRMTNLHWYNHNTNDTICAYHYTLNAMGYHSSEYRNEPNPLPVFAPTAMTSTFDTLNRIKDNGQSFGDDGQQISVNGDVVTFDEFDRPLTAKGNQYTYDGNATLRKKVKNGQTKQYVWDIVGGMTQLLIEQDGSGNALNYYVYGLGLISRIDANDEASYYHFDSRGSTIAMTNDTGKVTHSYAYGPFGELMAADETDFNAFRYIGQYGVMYEDTSLMYMRARFYDVETGRFLTEDPVWATNLYPYAGNNPIAFIDPEGEKYMSVSKWECKFGIYSHIAVRTLEVDEKRNFVTTQEYNTKTGVLSGPLRTPQATMRNADFYKNDLNRMTVTPVCSDNSTSNKDGYLVDKTNWGVKPTSKHGLSGNSGNTGDEYNKAASNTNSWYINSSARDWQRMIENFFYINEDLVR